MNYRKIITEKLRKIPDLQIAVLYGSIVDDKIPGKFKENSDIDIAVFGSAKKFDRLAALMILNDIDRDIDLVDMKKINPILGMQIIKHHDILVMKDIAIWEAWKTQILTQYHDLKISNREIIKDLGKYSPLDI